MKIITFAFLVATTIVLNGCVTPGAGDGIRHHVVQSGGDKRLVLTADTAELQRFVVKHLKTEAAWNESIKLLPVPAVAPPR